MGRAFGTVKRGRMLLAQPEFSRPSDSGRLQVNVIFTNSKATQAALRYAVELAMDLEAEIRVIVPLVVPFPLPLASPDIPLEFTCTQIRTLAEAAGADPDMRVCLCRDPIQALLNVLPAGSVTVIGARKRWFPTKAERIGRTLLKKGHDVLLARYS